MRDLMDERDKRYEQRFQSQQRALVEAKEDLGERLTLLNELRGDVATKTDVQALEKIIDALRTQITDIRERQSARDGRGAGMTAGWGILVAAALLAVAIFSAWRG